MLFCFADHADDKTLSLTPLTTTALDGWRGAQPSAIATHIERVGFTGKAGQIAWLPDGSGVVVGMGDGRDPMVAGSLPFSLPEGSYRVAGTDGTDLSGIALAWGLGAYRFERYRKSRRKPATLLWPDDVDRDTVAATVEATYLTRDLINTPTNDMGPAELAAAATDLATEFGASCDVIEGEALLEGYPMIHAVGRASVSAPRLIDLRWGDPNAKKVTLVGKGVCFDSGGLDLKSAANMLLMKKDMGGSAHVLGLARLIMATGLKVRLRVLVPAVENAVSGNAFRPSDVLQSRKGLTVEIGNTDAEGRLVLADALTDASSEKPDLMVDFATLTGAARVALGTDLPALFVNDDALAADFAAAAEASGDPLWRLPLWAPYDDLLRSDIADLSNTGSAPFGGAITAALFLQRFVGDGIKWAHIDLMAWNRTSRPGKPKGGEAMGLRAVYRLIADRLAG